MATKKTKKTKTDFKVILTDVESPADVYERIVEAKIEAGLNITPCEHVNYTRILVNKLSDSFLMVPFAQVEICKIPMENLQAEPKKPGLFKRFWNWITRKK